jgi:hypothetical protein
MKQHLKKLDEHLLTLYGFVCFWDVGSFNDIEKLTQDYHGYSSIILTVRNSESAADMIYDYIMDAADCPEADFWTAALLVLLVRADRHEYATELSRAMVGGGFGDVTASLAGTYLLSNKVKNDKLRISA